MKKKFILSLFLTPTIVFGQITIQNISLTKDTNLLYSYSPNMIEVKGAGANDAIELKAMNSNVVGTSKANVFKVTPVYGSTTFDDLRVFVNNKKVLMKTFDIAGCNTFYAALGTLKDTAVSLTAILANQKIEVLPSGCLYKPDIPIASFLMAAVSSKGDTLDNNIPGKLNLLSEHQTAAIKKLKSGDKLLFSEIIYYGNAGKARKLTPFYLTVK